MFHLICASIILFLPLSNSAMLRRFIPLRTKHTKHTTQPTNYSNTSHNNNNYIIKSIRELQKNALNQSDRLARIENEIYVTQAVVQQMNKKPMPHLVASGHKKIHRKSASTIEHAIDELPLSDEHKLDLYEQAEQLQKENGENRADIKKYFNFLLSLPWNTPHDNKIDTLHAQSILDEDHYGMQQVKNRILEFLAIKELKGDASCKPLCMVGSPGIGKTSLARSIARAMNRSFVHIGLAGVSSSMTIKGNERGYSGAIPGRILQQIKLAGYNNPVFLLDEIEKVSQSHHNGSPAAALLEVLDPDHNHRFTDEYLEVPFDLSQVMFLCGANYYDQIPAELRSRMEIIQLPNYTTEEKIAIAQKHLIKRVTEKTGLDTCNVTLEIDERTIEAIITHYTNEGGVRELEHALFRLGAHIARNIVDNNLHSQGQLANTYKITTNMLPTYLGKPLYIEDKSKYIL